MVTCAGGLCERVRWHTCSRWSEADVVVSASRRPAALHPSAQEPAAPAPTPRGGGRQGPGSAPPAAQQRPHQVTGFL